MRKKAVPEMRKKVGAPLEMAYAMEAPVEMQLDMQLDLVEVVAVVGMLMASMCPRMAMLEEAAPTNLRLLPLLQNVLWRFSASRTGHSESPPSESPPPELAILPVFSSVESLPWLSTHLTWLPVAAQVDLF